MSDDTKQPMTPEEIAAEKKKPGPRRPRMENRDRCPQRNAFGRRCLMYVRYHDGNPCVFKNDTVQAAQSARITELESSLASALKERDAIRDGSFCTKCGWSGVPKPAWGAAFASLSGWLCGNAACDYMVPAPKSAQIEQLNIALTSARDEIRVLSERLAKYEPLDGSCCTPPPNADAMTRDSYRLAHLHGCHWPGNHRDETCAPLADTSEEKR